MPRFTYSGTDGRTYSETRDSSGEIIGTVAPGDEYTLPEAPDHFWTPSGPTRSTVKSDKSATATPQPESAELPAAQGKGE